MRCSDLTPSPTLNRLRSYPDPVGASTSSVEPETLPRREDRIRLRAGLRANGSLDKRFGEHGALSLLMPIAAAPVSPAARSRRPGRRNRYGAAAACDGSPDPAFGGGSGIQVPQPGLGITPQPLTDARLSLFGNGFRSAINQPASTRPTWRGSSKLRRPSRRVSKVVARNRISIAVGAFALIGALALSAVALARSGGSDSLDQSYGVSGKATITQPPGDHFETWSVEEYAATPDGSVYVLGSGWIGNCYSCGPTYFVSRIGSNGSFDPGFGGETGIVLPNLPSGYQLSVDASGRLLVSSHDAGTVTIRRYETNGQADTSFGKGGTATVACGCQNAVVRVVAAQRGDTLVEVDRARPGEEYSPGPGAQFPDPAACKRRARSHLRRPRRQRFFVSRFKSAEIARRGPKRGGAARRQQPADPDSGLRHPCDRQGPARHALRPDCLTCDAAAPSPRRIPRTELTAGARRRHDRVARSEPVH